MLASAISAPIVPARAPNFVIVRAEDRGGAWGQP